MSESSILLLLAALVFLVLALPLLRRRGDPSAARRAVSVARADAADDDPADVALREIELDRQMGKLSEADYLALRAKYAAVREAGAAPAPARPGARAASTEAPAQSADRTELERRAEALVRHWRRHVVRCPECGERPEPDARYCSRCGLVLVPCPQCGSRVNETGARFCTRCGAGLLA